MLKKLGGAALLGLLAYTTADAAADGAMYLRAKSMVLEAAAANARFTAEVGAPLAAGPWYNSSVQFSHEGHIVTVVLPVRGSRRSSDVTLRAVRKGGLRSTLLHNLLGGGEWEPLVMNAMVGMGPGGTPISMSLLQAEEPDTQAVTSAAAAALGHGQRQGAAAPGAAAHVAAAQQQRQQQQPAANAASYSDVKAN